MNMKPREKACQGCDYIEAPVLDDSTRYFKEKLHKKHQAQKEMNEEGEDLTESINDDLARKDLPI